MSAADLHRIRLFINTRSLAEGLTEYATGRDPVIAHGGDVGFEIFLADGPESSTGTESIDVSAITRLSVAVMPFSRSGEALMARGVTSLTAKTLEDFQGGAPADCHAQVKFSYADTQILASGEKEETRWLIVYGYVGGGRKIFGAGVIQVIRPGVPDSDAGDLSGPAGRFHEGQQQLLLGSDWYGLTTAVADGVRILTISQTAFAGTFVLGATGSDWGVGDGQLFAYTGSAWQAVESRLQDGVLVAKLADTTTATEPNGTLVGANYRVRAGINEAKHPTTGYWHALEIRSVNGALTVAWAETYSQV